MQIWCDDREHEICSRVRGQYDHVFIDHLTVGDFLIGYPCPVRNVFIPLVVVERKTWADLAASLKDGRTRNIEKLRTYRDTTGARIAYLLEGSRPANAGATSINGIPYLSLRAHVDHLLFRDQIIELHTTGVADTIRRLLEFATHLRPFMEQPPAQPDAPDGLACAKIPKTYSPEEISDKIWSSFAGISATSARAFRSLKIGDLYTGVLTAEALAALPVGARKFGPKRASALIEARTDVTTFQHVLCAVPSISVKRAQRILDVCGLSTSDFATFFNKWAQLRPLVENAIGKACVARLESCFGLK